MQLDTQQINKFIYNVFNYYNGRINIFNPAVLHIEWVRKMNSSNGATTRNPNIITIYPMVIYRHFADPHWFYYNIILCIIHELFHIDQDISYIQMATNPKYVHEIESIVEMESYLYIANHQIEILMQFGFEDTIPYNNYYNAIKDTFEIGKLYTRRDYRTHMISILKDILHCEEHPIIDKFDSVFRQINSNINVILNGSTFVLKNKNLCMPIAQLNEILEQEFFRYNLRSANVWFINSSAEENTKVLIINSDCSNFIGKVVL